MGPEADPPREHSDIPKPYNPDQKKLPLIGIMLGILILRPLKKGWGLFRGLHDPFWAVGFRVSGFWENSWLRACGRFRVVWV